MKFKKKIQTTIRFVRGEQWKENATAFYPVKY